MTEKQPNTSKENLIKKSILRALLISLLIVIVIFANTIELAMVLSLIFSIEDINLIIMLSFYSYAITPFILLSIWIYKVVNAGINNKKNKKVYLAIIILVFALIGKGIVGGAYTYYMDIKEGSKEAIITDAYLKIEGTRHSLRTYLIGYIDGEKIKLKVTEDAKSKLKHNKNYKTVKIKYYEHIKEVFDIGEYVISY